MTEAPIGFQIGPFAIMGLLLVAGFLGLLVYAAWRQGQGYRPPVRDFMAFAIVIGFFATMAVAFYRPLGDAGDILLGALIAAFSAVVALYFRRNGE